MHEQELRVRVGYQEDFPPFVGSGPDGPRGLAVDILATGFEKLGIAPFCKQEDFDISKLEDLKNFSGFSCLDFSVSFGDIFALFKGK